MKIIVPIKQVPATGDVRMDPDTGTMVRKGTRSVINPLDLFALEAAFGLKRKRGGSVTAITMGPQQAETALREAISLGCDDAILLSDRKFAGSDTWATSCTIAAAIARLAPWDLIITGERATDGDTGQVGPGIAAWLDVPLATFVAHISQVTDGTITVERLMEEGYQAVELALPALLTVVKEAAAPSLPTLSGKRAAGEAEIVRWDAAFLGLDEGKIGLRGSPTRVVKIATSVVGRTGTFIDASEEGSVPAAAESLLAFLRERELIP